MRTRTRTEVVSAQIPLFDLDELGDELADFLGVVVAAIGRVLHRIGDIAAPTARCRFDSFLISAIGSFHTDGWLPPPALPVLNQPLALRPSMDCRYGSHYAHPTRCARQSGAYPEANRTRRTLFGRVSNSNPRS